jgi:hypothetical protein
VGILQRLDPRRLDGRRMLRFVCGLALVALAVAIRVDVAAAAAEPDRTAPTVAAASAAAAPAIAAPQTAAADSAAADSAAPVSAPEIIFTIVAAPGHTTGAVVTGTDAVPPAGSTPASHDSRAPPA